MSYLCTEKTHSSNRDVMRTWLNRGLLDYVTVRCAVDCDIFHLLPHLKPFDGNDASIYTMWMALLIRYKKLDFGDVLSSKFA